MDDFITNRWFFRFASGRLRADMATTTARNNCLHCSSLDSTGKYAACSPCSCGVADLDTVVVVAGCHGSRVAAGCQASRHCDNQTAAVANDCSCCDF